MIDIRQTQEYANYLKREGWIVERVAEINYFIKKIPLIGSVMKVQRPEEIRIDTIRELSRKYGAFQIIVEPKNGLDAKFLASTGFKLSKSPYLPTKTLQIDLTKSQDYIFRHFKKDARQIIRKGSGFTIHEYSTPDEIRKFREGWKNAVNFKRFVPSEQSLINLRKSLPGHKSLFLASHNIVGSIIGGVIFTTSSHERSNYITYYWQAFTNHEGRALLSQYTLLYHGILWAKKHGYGASGGSKIFDFEGIYDSRFPNKTWLGFTHFKRSFGGYDIEYPGTYVKFRLPI